MKARKQSDQTDSRYKILERSRKVPRARHNSHDGHPDISPCTCGIGIDLFDKQRVWKVASVLTTFCKAYQVA